MPRRFIRALMALLAAAALGAVPIAQVAACSCMQTTLPQAVRDAKLAFVGTLVASDVPEGIAGPGDESASFTWQVERASASLDSSLVSVRGWPDSGANCGVTFGANERWLVLTYDQGGALETNSCLPNQRLDGSNPDVETEATEMLTVVVAPNDSPEALVPMPVLVAATALLLVVAVGFFAFRTRRS